MNESESATEPQRHREKITEKREGDFWIFRIDGMGRREAMRIRHTITLVLRATLEGRDYASARAKAHLSDATFPTPHP